MLDIVQMNNYMRLRLFGAIGILIACISCGAKKDISSSELIPRTSPVQTGETAPDFTLNDQNDQAVTLSSARGKTPVVLVFYRGHW